MRLLHVDGLEFAEFRDDEAQPYAILSHRWQSEEPTFQDVNNRTSLGKKGYEKIKGFSDYIKQNLPDIKWLWIDTCCINKDSAAELSESINLMFKWYRNAEICIAYIADVFTPHDCLTDSEWFNRGWTLQELIAPRVVIFVTNTWQVIGNKGAAFNQYSETATGSGLESEIAARTGIPEPILHDIGKGFSLTVDERLKWMKNRQTAREEDMSYGLYGVFGVSPGANYGEGGRGAKQRLLGAIHQQERDEAAQRDEYKRIVDWLSPTDPWTLHNTARERHEAGTGSWVLDDPRYRDWIEGSTRVLWLFGKAGCGKTVLSSTAIENVRQYCEQHVNATYAVFYFTFSDTRKQRYRDLLLSLVSQLAFKGPARVLLQEAHGNPSRSLTSSDLERILLAAAESGQEVFLLLDALDECPEDDDARHNLLSGLTRISQAVSAVRIFATSRKLPDIQHSFTEMEAESIAVATYAVNEDIRQHVKSQLSQDTRLARLDVATKRNIENTLYQKADGM